MADFTDVSTILGPGVYALVVRGEVVYIGKAKKMLMRLYQHRNNYRKYRTDGIHIGKAIYFTHVWIHPCKEIDLDRIEREMITKYQPRENTNLIPKDRHLTLESSGFDFVVMGMDIRPRDESSVFERRF